MARAAKSAGSRNCRQKGEGLYRDYSTQCKERGVRIEEQVRDIRNAMLTLIGRTGVATQVQIAEARFVNRSRLQKHLKGLTSSGFVEELEGFRYFPGKAGRSSPIYRLTAKGAARLRSIGENEAVASKLSEKAVLQHA